MNILGGIIRECITINLGIVLDGAKDQCHCTVITITGIMVLFPLTQLMDIDTRSTLEVYGPRMHALRFNFQY